MVLTSFEPNGSVMKTVGRHTTTDGENVDLITRHSKEFLSQVDVSTSTTLTPWRSF